MKKVEVSATMYVHPNGSVWTEANEWVKLDLEDGWPVYRVNEIRDGTNQPMPLMVFVIPDRRN